MSIITLTKHAPKDSNSGVPLSGAGAPEIKITPEMIEAALEWLYAYNPDFSDGREIVRGIIQAALANSVQLSQKDDQHLCISEPY